MKPRTIIVTISRPPEPDSKWRPARLEIPGRKVVHEVHLSPETRAALGTDLTGRFEAERIGETWWIGERIDGERSRA